MRRGPSVILLALLPLLGACGRDAGPVKVEAKSVAPAIVLTDPEPWTTLPEPTTSTTEAPTTTTTVAYRRATVRATGTSIWDAIAQCESGGNWADTRGGYEGGLHFMWTTWVQAGGRKYAEHAYDATREQQIEIAQSWLERTSWDQWPVCSRKVGAR